jgi:hypothetical protein
MKKLLLFVGLVLTLASIATVAAQEVATTPEVAMEDQSMMMGTPSVVVRDQVSLDGTVVIDSVYSAAEGFVVIHTDNGGAPGPVAGVGAVQPGMNAYVRIKLYEMGMADPTPTLFAMLHVDDTAIGTYEFGTVEGADGPVIVAEQVVTFPINIAPSMTLADQAIGEGGTLTIPSVLIDASGWLVIHSSVDGAPGPVLGQAYLSAGLSSNVVVSIDASGAGSQVFPMLHYDTGAAGMYEFGAVEGADAPVFVREAVVVAPMGITP